MIKKISDHVLWRAKYIFNISLPQLFLSQFVPHKVMSGPFKGMKYLNTSVGSVFLPKIIGTYEDELHKVFNEVKSNDYSCFMDIGAAEGYYAVGLKKYIFPSIKKTIAFEATTGGRKLIKKLGYLNNVDDINIEGFCDINLLLTKITDDKVFILVDIEGGEFELLNPKKINFNKCDILVEIHSIPGIDVELELKKRFSDTHNIVTIRQSVKKLPDSISWHPLIMRNAEYVVNEFRSSSQNWLFLKSKVN